MKFDQMCHIILNERTAKGEKFAKLIIGNQNPVFTREDVLRDPTDPSKGQKLYLSTKEEKEKGQEPGSEQSVRRSLRRLNWIAKTLIKKHGKKQTAFSIDDMNKVITDLLERYQIKVLGKEAPDKANTAYETRVIGNILLPPTNRNPSGKSVLVVPGMDPNATVADAGKAVTPKVKSKKTGKVETRAPTTANDLVSRFNSMADYVDDILDPDLASTVRDIVKGGKAGKEDEEDDIADKYIDTEKKKDITFNDVLKDERVKNIFDKRAVKSVLDSLVRRGAITMEPDGTLHDVKDPEEMEDVQALQAARSGEKEPGEVISVPELEPEELPEPEEVENPKEIEKVPLSDIPPEEISKELDAKPEIPGKEEEEEESGVSEETPEWWPKTKEKDEDEGEEEQEYEKF